MLAKYTALVSALLSTAAVASLNGRAEFVPQIFDRTTRPAGGWSLSLNTQESCPSDAPPCGSTWCCPASLTCVPTADADIAEACCPGSIDCISAFQAVPACADDSWSLWNATLDTANNAEYFCCLPGQSGMQDGTCVPSDQISSPTQLAAQLGGGSSGTISPSTSSASSTASSIGSSLSSSASVKSASTTGSSSASSATKTSGSTGSSTLSATKGSGKTASSGGSGSTATTSTASSSSSPATQTSNAGARNVVGAGVVGLVGALGFAVGIL